MLKLNVKSIYIFLFLTVVLNSSAQNSEKKEIILDEYTTIKAGFILPVAIGDNFASKGMNFRYGFDFNFDYHFKFKLFLGLKYQYLRATPDDISLVGNFDRTNVNLYSINLGYTFNISDKWSIQHALTYGTTVYNNKKDFSGDGRGRVKFTDDARSYILSSSLIYVLNDKTQFFFKTEYRTDVMDIETAVERQDFFDQAQFINLQLGINLKFL